MNKYLITLSILSTSACSAAKDRPELEYQFPTCGTSQLNGKTITKVCATRDFIAPEPRKRKRDWFAFLAAEGSRGYYGPIDPVGGVLHFENKELNMHGHVWDFSKQESPSLVLEGHNTTIQNGLIFNTTVNLGSHSYFPLNFTVNDQINNLNAKKYGFLYANNDFECAIVGKKKCTKSSDFVERFFLKNMKIQSYIISLSSWGGGILSSDILLDKRIYINGSRAVINNNKIYARINLEKNEGLFTLNKVNKGRLTDYSQQIFPDRSDDKTAIPSVLYVKFSPDTVVDGNTFTLTHKSDQAYAIVLDHSPRVRITNNTFNGFKVPILMDQWSSIIDDKGNVLNSNQFAGDVTMNRKGEIVKK